MNQNGKHIHQDSSLRWNKTSTQQHTNSETLEQQKSNSWTPVGPTKDRSLGPSQLKALCQSQPLVWGPTHRRAINEVCKVVIRDWVNHQACSLSHNIHVEYHGIKANRAELLYQSIFRTTTLVCIGICLLLADNFIFFFFFFFFFFFWGGGSYTVYSVSKEAFLRNNHASIIHHFDALIANGQEFTVFSHSQ